MLWQIIRAGSCWDTSWFNWNRTPFGISEESRLRWFCSRTKKLPRGSPPISYSLRNFLVIRTQRHLLSSTSTGDFACCCLPRAKSTSTWYRCRFLTLPSTFEYSRSSKSKLPSTVFTSSRCDAILGSNTLKSTSGRRRLQKQTLI